MLTWIGMVWTKLIIVVEINSPRPSSVMSKDRRRRRFWNHLWMCRGAVLVFLLGLMDRKRKPIVGRAFATAKESWSQLGTSYKNWDICLLLMTETIATARKIVKQPAGKENKRTEAMLECWEKGHAKFATRSVHTWVDQPPLQSWVDVPGRNILEHKSPGIMLTL